MVRQTWICKGFNMHAPCTEDKRCEYKVNAKSVDEAIKKARLKFKEEHGHFCFMRTTLKRI